MKSRTKRNTTIAVVIILILVLIGCYGYFWERFRFQVNRQDLTFSDLPAAFEGYRIVQLSDLHIGSFSGGFENEVQNLVDLINQQKPDLIVFTGDIVNFGSDELKGYKPILSQLSAPDGVLSILGNHDYALYRRKLTRAQQKADVKQLVAYERSFGWKTLLNENVKIERDGTHIYIIGVENQGYLKSYFPKFARLDRAMKGVSESDFKILLTHDPTHWRHDIVDKTNIQLTLSGHTHAGQFEVFGWSPVSWAYDEWQGLYYNDDQILNVSIGAGSLIPFRLGAQPEINVLTLHCGK